MLHFQNIVRLFNLDLNFHFLKSRFAKFVPQFCKSYKEQYQKLENNISIFRLAVC